MTIHVLEHPIVRMVLCECLVVNFLDNCEDGQITEDDEGIELSGLGAAKYMAARTLADLARDALPAASK